MRTKVWGVVRAGYGWLQSHARELSLGGGLIVAALWTVLRHFTNGVNFDVVGQVGLAQQWAHGFHGGATVGPTNYLLKMPLYMLVNLLGFLGPHGRLLLLALICNLLTFWALFDLFEKILDLYAVNRREWFYLAFAWLATISGTVFWVDYANSRNLEVVGGVLVLFLIMRALKRPGRRDVLWISLVTAITLFADSLQVFMVVLPIALYLLIRAAAGLFRDGSRVAWNSLLPLAGLAVGYGAYKLLFAAVPHIMPVHFLALPAPVPVFTASNVWATIVGTASATCRIFDVNFLKHPVTLNALRELFNAVLLAGAAYVLARLAMQRPDLQRKSAAYPKWLLLLMIAADYAVFAASGQALQWQTQRYLIFVPLLVVLLAGLGGGSVLGGVRPWRLRWPLITGLVLSSCLLFGALVISWPQRYAKDAFIIDTIQFLRSNHYTYAVASREVGITSTYFADSRPAVLPVLCTAQHRLSASDLFYDQKPFGELRRSTSAVPVIIQNNAITYGTNHCSREDIIAQFGQPQRELPVPGVGVAEIYGAGQVDLRE